MMIYEVEILRIFFLLVLGVGCSHHDLTTWCIACKSEQGGAQGNDSRVCQ